MSRGKVIITGGCGYIGSHTSVELIKNKFDVVIFDDLSNSKEFIMDRIYQIAGVKPAFEKVDLSNPIEADRAYYKHSDAHSIINFAAFKAVGESVEKPILYYKNNLYTLINSIEAQKKYGIKNFIFSSSATVYGNPNRLPITESFQTKRAFSPYGNSKKIAEEILEDFSKAYPEFKTISLRYFNPIGAHESGLIGELPNGIPNNLLPYVTQCAAGVLKELQVFGNDYNTKDGTPIRDYVHVVDLAKAHVKALERLLSGNMKENYDVYNLGTGKGVTVMDIINTFEKVTKEKINYRITKRRAGDVQALFASAEKAKNNLGWEATLSLENMIETSWNWEKTFRDM
ncbi:UDP-galactose 4-epimerase [Tenacibaculum sp. MAR_2009_124]|uniref:UDP-glucose 4-epimerase GalE n=1 Tax=Tenacibaculum sp. MAR_2009_124 TaxID=1250059 RepID=UPI00089999B5|nr:UDP-glucose 4-epimerase GalE [Tenacibaculum sp. MAR_2009_124]SED13669.1 UDP-galactose 4-epimerase [Tenacibaculum sp. MAR_2009_124]